MPRTTRQTFRYNCPACGAVNTATCKRCGVVYKFDPTLGPGEKLVNRHLTFGDKQWERMAARAKMLGISVNEFVRMSCYDTLSMPASRLIS